MRKWLTGPEAVRISPTETALLRWLLWHPLLSAHELARLEQSRQRHAPDAAVARPVLEPASISQVRRDLRRLKRGLVLAFRLKEPGWPVAEERYALTVAGVTAFAHQFQPPLSAEALACAYPIEQEDLLSRLACPVSTLVLATCFTSLIEGARQDWQVRVFQFPCSLRSLQRLAGWSEWSAARTRPLNAALCLLQSSQPEQQSVPLLLLPGPHQEQPFPWRQAANLLGQLARLYQANGQEPQAGIPLVLVVSTAAHLPAWSDLLQQLASTQCRVPQGGMLLVEQVRQEGFLTAPCWRFAELAALRASSTSAWKAAATQRPTVSTLLLEQMRIRSQQQADLPQPGEDPALLLARQSHLWTRSKQPSWRRLGHPVRLPDARWAASLIRGASRQAGADVSTAGTLATAARLNLTLTAWQKRLLLLVARFPLLSRAQAAQLLGLKGQAERRLQRLLVALLATDLLTCYRWSAAPGREQERLLPTQAAAGYLVTRGALPPYWGESGQLVSSQHGPLWLPPQARGLLAQMQHTHGLYTCLAALSWAATQEPAIDGSWIWSTRESARRWFDPRRRQWIQLRPDATWIIWLRGQPLPVCLLIEYDRATRQREFLAKAETYAIASQQTGGHFPPVLIITTQPRTVARIHTCWQLSRAPQPMLLLLQAALDQPATLHHMTDWLLQLCSLP
uniref:Uncharacterized protein n=1 Tax=Thermogemmatispora argillosa TaxID=2045280 RepID=A0A455SV30_9CHLR|nr:hypothetical protein KTA_04820 [Thermogemmatispora argillosa]